MKSKVLLLFTILLLLVGTTGFANAAIIDFTGGTAYLSGGSSVTTTNTDLWYDVDYYIEDGMMIDFVGDFGYIGDYYCDSAAGGIGGYGDSVIHAHPFSNIDIVFSKVDGSDFDLTYVDMTSNTEVGGGLATGNERSFITTNSGHSLMLASSDWGVNYTNSGQVGDGIVTNYLDGNFSGISSFTISSENAFCFGMDNFYIDEPAPPVEPVPEPSTILLMGAGLLGLVGYNRKRFSKMS